MIFVDESSINCGMMRLYGRAYKKERVNEYVPDVRFERTSIISSIRLNGETTPLIFKDTRDGKAFKAYISDVLAPTVKKGDIVVIDNLPAHKVKGALAPIYRRGAHVLFLPPYSPDFNPIELSWAKMKAVLKKLKPRTYDELIASLQIALNSFTKKDIYHWFYHFGYIYMDSGIAIKPLTLTF